MAVAFSWRFPASGFHESSASERYCGSLQSPNMHPLFPQGTSGFSCTSSLMRRRRKRLSKLAIHAGILAASTEGGHASNGQRGCSSAKRREQQPSTNKVAVHTTLRDPISLAYP